MEEMEEMVEEEQGEHQAEAQELLAQQIPVEEEEEEHIMVVILEVEMEVLELLF